MAAVEIPKQWKNWLKAAGLKTTYDSGLSRKRRCMGTHYLKGHGRYWRLDGEGYFDKSEPLETFDRWANSLEDSEPMTAKTKTEFVAFVHALRDAPVPDKDE